MRDWHDSMLGLGLVIQLTVTFVVSVLVPLGFGVLFDRLLRTSPLMVLITTLFGVTAGTILVTRVVAREYLRLGGQKR